MIIREGSLRAGLVNGLIVSAILWTIIIGMVVAR